jgi:hypothetical protein
VGAFFQFKDALPVPPSETDWLLERHPVLIDHSRSGIGAPSRRHIKPL